MSTARALVILAVIGAGVWWMVRHRRLVTVVLVLLYVRTGGLR